MSTGEYCRAIEAYLCRTNGGHLVRIVGPSFERVCGWEARGIPLRIVYRGIDRAVERRRAKGATGRRPLPIDFCEADILDAFDEWRRAVGVAAAPPGGAGEAPVQAEARRPPTLAAHLDRVIARLSARRAGAGDRLDATLSTLTRELDAVRATARQSRGAARAALVARLDEMDQELRAAAWAEVSEAERAAIGREADGELAPFRLRMAADAYARARDASIERLVRDRARLPTVRFDG